MLQSRRQHSGITTPVEDTDVTSHFGSLFLISPESLQKKSSEEITMVSDSSDKLVHPLAH